MPPTALPHGSSRSFIAGTGCYIPRRVLTNSDLEAFLDTSDEWIFDRTGIRERRIASDDEVTSDLGAEACRRALLDANVDPAAIDLLIVGTFTADTPLPSCAARIQKKLGLRPIPAFDVSAACASFVYGLGIADQFLKAGGAERALVVSAEILSRVTDWTDRGTAVLFGDGAGAVVLEARRAGKGGVVSTSLGSDGTHADSLQIPAGGSAEPIGIEPVAQGRTKMRMQGQEIFRYAVESMSACAKTAVENARLTLDDIAWIVPHQANRRIIAAVAHRLGVPLTKFIVNIEARGNTSGASIPIALDEARKDGRVKPGDRVLFTALGAGLAWGAAVVEM
jgi:3-oxoacyl-[acyl-carrier-protein] synthase-3